jgi:ADP-ribose pyrophosphatase
MKKIVPHSAILIPDSAQRVFEGEIFDVYQWPQKMYDGSIARFEMLRREDVVQAICIVGDDIIILDDEQPNRAARLTMPGGRLEPGEEPLAGAKREILEETGYEFNQWKLVRVVQPQQKLEWFVYTFVAWDVAGQSATQHDVGEKITVELKSWPEVKRLVAERAGVLGFLADLVSGAETLDDFKHLPEFKGKTIER